MTLTVKHAFVSLVADDPSVPGEVRPSNWNDDHVITGTFDPTGSTLASGAVWVGSAGNVAAAVLFSGDVTLSNTGVTALATAQPAVHTWALAQTFTVAPVFTDASGTRTALGLGTLATQSGTFSGTSSGTNTGDQTTVSGNAGTATALQTARTINGTSFNGTADITVAAAAGTLTGTTLAAGVVTSSLTTIGTLAGGSVPASLVTGLTSSSVGLGSVTNDAQTKAAIVPNTAPAAGALLVGNAGGTAYASVAASGDITVASTGAATIAAAAVTLAKQANLAANSIQGNNTGSSATPIALTVAQTNSLLQGDGLTSGQAGSRNIIQNSKSAAYTTVAADAGGCIYHPAADTSARTWTIDSNANVAYPIGTTITFDNDVGAGVLTIAITSDTLVLVGTAGSTGSRTIASGGQATAMKVTSTRWRISGIGIS